jgi:hypothetical protein
MVYTTNVNKALIGGAMEIQDTTGEGKIGNVS